jgi:hypothetical protein
MKIVGVVELPAQLARETPPDCRLARAGDAHQDYDHASSVPESLERRGRGGNQAVEMDE